MLAARQDSQIVSTAWHALSTSQHVANVAAGGLGYGYYWWTVPQAGGYSAWGHGGQFIFVVPSRRLVLVLVSMPDTDPGLHGGDLDSFVDLTRPLWQP